MNFAKKRVIHSCGFFFLISLFLLFSGCQSIQATDPAVLDEFLNAGPLKPEIDIDRLLESKMSSGDYRLIPDDLIELQIPEVLQGTDALISSEMPRGYVCRLRLDGSVTVPVIGTVQAEGLTIPELEARIIEAYYPRYTQMPPSVVARVIGYNTIKVSITGAVNQPGIYELRDDQRSVVSLIMTAGGIVKDGAAVIKISQPNNAPSAGQIQEVRFSFRSDFKGPVGTVIVRNGSRFLYSEKIDVTDYFARTRFADNLIVSYPNISRNFVLSRLSEFSEKVEPGTGDSTELLLARQQEGHLMELLQRDIATGTPRSYAKTTPFVLPVKGMNIPFSDIELSDGARVEIEALDPEMFTVIGLVKRPGAFQYPPNAEYNLMQALAFAGGVDQIADPRFVRVYRQNEDGGMVDATFKIAGTSAVGSANIKIKPGDVVAVEQTSRTKRNLLIASMFRLSVGASYTVFDGRDFRRTD